MEKLKTVCGEITREQLGITTTHEHVLLDLTAFYTERPVKGIKSPSTQKVKMDNLGILSRDCYALKDNLLLDNERLQAKELKKFGDAGGKTVVDASLPGIGRDAKALKRISQKTGLNIVMGTGFYVGETHPKELADMTDREIADIMVKELTEGVDGTDIKAGYIGEIGISEIFDEKERKNLAAAVREAAGTLDCLFGFPFPYMMCMHQGAVNCDETDYHHFHIEFFPPMRSKDKIKFNASSETGAWAHCNPTCPEEKALELIEAHKKYISEDK
jgi:predicted metal-dependent phosphotriesterase family hydrolase